MVQSLQLLQLKLDLEPSSVMYPSLKLLPLPHKKQILCLKLVEDWFSVALMSRYLILNSLLLGTDLDLSLNSQRLIHHVHESLLPLVKLILVVEALNLQLLQLKLDLVQSSALYPLLKQKQSLNLVQSSLELVVLPQTLSSSTLGRQLRILNSEFLVMLEFMFFQNILVLDQSLFVLLVSELHQNHLLHGFHLEKVDFMDLVVLQNRLVRIHQNLLNYLKSMDLLEIQNVDSLKRNLYKQESLEIMVIMLLTLV